MFFKDKKPRENITPRIILYFVNYHLENNKEINVTKLKILLYLFEAYIMSIYNEEKVFEEEFEAWLSRSIIKI